MSSITAELASLSGPVVYLIVAALVFGETAVFLGFVLPGETAVVLGGVLASRGQVSLPVLMIVVVAAAVAGPMIGYEIGRHIRGRLAGRRDDAAGDLRDAGMAQDQPPGAPRRGRLGGLRVLRRMAGPAARAEAVLRDRGAAAVLIGRFTAVLRALMPAAAGAARMPYRTFVLFNVAGGIVWGIGYCLLGFAAGSAYQVIERRVGAGVAIVVAVAVLAAVAVWMVRRHRREGGAESG